VLTRALAHEGCWRERARALIRWASGAAPEKEKGMSARRVLVVIAAALLSLALSGTAAARVLIVTKRNVRYRHFSSIQAAVNAAHPGDWILIDRGVYIGPVVIKKARLHLRGMNRNGVIVDGRHRAANGIEVFKANGVWIENLTVRNFDRATRDDDSLGNEIWWNGGKDSGRIGMRGWWGQNLTVYDTGLLGGYGLFTSNAVNGYWKHVYASGFNDSGFYIGACRDCRALIQDALAERNALGYSGTNSGGHLVIEDSIFRQNGLGVAPNTESNGDPPPPQNGACNSGTNRSPTPTFTSTRIARCTVFEDNRIVDNGNISTPANNTLLGAPWGVGVMLPGDYADLVRDNVIRGNPNFGMLVFEFPDPFPPTSQTVFFQAAGNRASHNRFARNGTRAGGADIGLEGGAFGSMSSVNNCFSSNAVTSSIPSRIQGTWGCRHATTPNGGTALVAKILSLITESSDRTSRPQPPPLRQPTMPNPCRGVPRNPLCG
jgi:hypothetical protein